MSDQNNHTQVAVPPCPFCGNVSTIYEAIGGEAVRCEVCSIKMWLEKWNARHAPAPAVSEDVAPVGLARVAELLREKQARAAHYDDVCGVAADTLEAQAAALTRKTSLLEWFSMTCNDLKNELLEAEAEVARLTAERDALYVRVKTLEAALRPFVAYVHDDLRKGKATYELVAVDRAGGGLISAKDLRCARDALNPKGD